MGGQAKKKALLERPYVANGTAWQRIEDAAAEWELPVDSELHRRIGSAAAGELLYANAVGPGALVPTRPSCAGAGARGTAAECTQAEDATGYLAVVKVKTLHRNLTKFFQP
ncbi:hypothetical protein ABZP36_003579 [Zizania latifolia]